MPSFNKYASFCIRKIFKIFINLYLPRWSLTGNTYREPWSSLVDGDEGSYLPNRHTDLIIVLHELSRLFRNFINTTAYHLGWSKPSSPSTKGLHHCRPRNSTLVPKPNWITSNEKSSIILAGRYRCFQNLLKYIFVRMDLRSQFQ